MALERQRERERERQKKTMPKPNHQKELGRVLFKFLDGKEQV